MMMNVSGHLNDRLWLSKAKYEKINQKATLHNEKSKLKHGGEEKRSKQLSQT